MSYRRVMAVQIVVKSASRRSPLISSKPVSGQLPDFRPIWSCKKSENLVAQLVIFRWDRRTGLGSPNVRNGPKSSIYHVTGLLECVACCQALNQRRSSGRAERRPDRFRTPVESTEG